MLRAVKPRPCKTLEQYTPSQARKQFVRRLYQMLTRFKRAVVDAQSGMTTPNANQEFVTYFAAQKGAYEVAVRHLSRVLQATEEQHRDKLPAALEQCAKRLDQLANEAGAEAEERLMRDRHPLDQSVSGAALYVEQQRVYRSVARQLRAVVAEWQPHISTPTPITVSRTSRGV